MSNSPTNIIKDLELELLQPHVRKSAKQLNELLADTFFEFGASGNIYHKKDTLEHLPTSPKANFTICNFSLISISDDIHLATYKAEKEIQETGEKMSSLRSSLWKKDDGKWQLIFHQGTPL